MNGVTMDPAQFSDCWCDDERMNFMFSAFPATRSVNPHHWDTKMRFWKKLIEDMCDNSSYGYITWDNLFSHLSRHHKQPLGLQVVFEDMLEKGEIVPAAQYTQDMSDNNTWIGWGLNWCVKKPVGWMADKVLSPIKTRPGRDMKKGRFVMKSAIEHKCNKLIVKLQQFFSISNNEQDYEFLNIITYSKLQDLSSDLLCDLESLDLVLMTLRKNKNVAVRTQNELFTTKDDLEKNINGQEGEKYIKFAKKGEKNVIGFSETDAGILRLCETKLHLQKLIDNSYTEIQQRNKSIRDCLRNGQRTKAKNLLIKRKRLETSLEKKEGNLDNVEQLLESLHQCKTDEIVMQTYKTAVAAYKDATKGLSEDAIRETMDDVANVLDKHADITEALSDSVAGHDTHDLEAELASLMSSETTKSDIDDICEALGSVNVGQDLPKLPSPPSHSPSSEGADVNDQESLAKISVPSV